MRWRSIEAGVDCPSSPEPVQPPHSSGERITAHDRCSTGDVAMTNRGSKAKPSRKRRAVAKKSRSLSTKKPARKRMTVAGAILAISVMNSLWDLTAHLIEAGESVLKILEHMPHLAYVHYQRELDNARLANGRLDERRAARILAQASAFNHILKLVAKQLQDRAVYLAEFPNASEALVRRLISTACEVDTEQAPSAIRADIDAWYLYERFPAHSLKRSLPKPRRRI